MASTNKTGNLKLNQWLGSDIPSRSDFNNDNEILDGVICGHTEDLNLHTSESEKAIWNTPYYMTSYYGDGSATRTVTFDCDFNPKWGIVFAHGSPPSLVDITNKSKYNYFAFFSTIGSTIGVTLSGKSIEVIQSATPLYGSELRSFNEKGTVYVCILFR